MDEHMTIVRRGKSISLLFLCLGNIILLIC